ncbi:MAG: DUF4235 domain-containing protein [Angustibacter sp.]
MSAMVWKALGTGGAVAAGIAANKALTAGWKIATGHPPPNNPEHPDTNWVEAVAFVVLSGALIAAARTLGMRQAAEYYRRSTGHLPPKMESPT